MSIFYDGQPGPEVREQLNALYDAFAGSAYPPTAGMFAPGTLSAPSVRGTADPSTGWNLLNGEAHLSVGGALKIRATANGLLDFSGNPLLSSTNAVGSLLDGAIIEGGTNANGKYRRFSSGLVICQKRFDGLPPSSALGSIFTSSSMTWDFPVSFVSFPGVFGIEEGGVGGCWLVLGASATSTSSTSFRVASAVQSASPASVTITAIGLS